MTHRSLQTLVDELIESGTEYALQVAVVRDGEPVAEAFGGRLHPGVGESDRVDRASLFPVFSVSKGVSALAAYRCIDRGTLDFDTALGDVWPAFARGDRARISLGEVLAHTAGLAHFPPVQSFAQFCDWGTMAEAVAGLVPEGRGEPRYHALTYGWLVGETVRRATGGVGDFGEIVRRELFSEGPADFWFGIPDDVERRVATVLRDSEPVDDGRPLARAIPARFGTTQSVYGRGDVRRACLPAVNGIGNALTLASLYSRAASGDLVDDRVMDEGVRLCSHQVDGVMGTYVARSRGFYVAAPVGEVWSAPFTSGAASFGHPGAGGSLAWGDRRSKAGFAICRSRLTGDGWRHPQMQRLISTALESVAS